MVDRQTYPFQEALVVLLVTPDPDLEAVVKPRLSAPQSKPGALPAFQLYWAADMEEAVTKADCLMPDLVLLHWASVDEAAQTSWRSRLGHLPLCLVADAGQEEAIEAMLAQESGDYLRRADLDTPLLGRVLYDIYRQHRVGTAVTSTNFSSLQAQLPLVSQLNLDRALDAILEQIAYVIPYDTATIQYIDGATSYVLRLRTSENAPTLAELKKRSAVLSFNIDEFANLRQLVQTQRPLVVTDTAVFPGWVRLSNEPPLILSWVGAPLLDQNHLWGMVTLDKAERGFYNAQHGDQLAVLANQATLALRNAQLYEETKRQMEELHILHAVAIACTEVTNVDELYEETTDIIARTLYPDNFGILLLDDEGNLRPHASYHVRLSVSQPIFVPKDRGVVGWVAQNGRVRRIPDVSQEPDYLPIDPHTASELCVPLKIHQKIIGVINAESIHLGNFSAADERLLTILAQQLTIILEKIRLLSAEQQRRKEAEILRDAMAALTSNLEVDSVLDEILVQLEKVVPNDTASLMLVENGMLCIRAVNGFHNPAEQIGRCFPLHDPFFQEVQRTRQPIYLLDASADPRFHDWTHAGHIQGWICAPLMVHGRVMGVLTVDNHHYGAYGPVEAALTQAFANQAAIAIENARLYTTEQSAHQTAEILRTVNEALTQTLDPNRVLETLLNYLVEVVAADSGCIMQMDESGEHVQLHFMHGYEQWTDATAVSQTRLNIRANHTLEPIFQHRQSMLISDTAVHPDWEQVPVTSYVRSWIGVPIMVGDQVIGAFSLDKGTPHFFTVAHLKLVQTVTSQAGVALKNAQLFAEVERRASELEAITEISAALRLAQSVDEMLPMILARATAVVGGIFSGIYLVEPTTNDLVLIACLPANLGLMGRRHSQSEGITGHVVTTGQLYVSDNVLEDPRFVPFQTNQAFFSRLRAGISLPLQVQTQVIGVMHVGTDSVRQFSREEINLLKAISEIAASALSRALLLETLEQRVARRTNELAEANERLQELDRLKTKFVSDVSHELRTPITNLTLYLDLLERGRPERREQYQSILRKQVDRLNSLIEDTLQLSRLDMGKTQMQLAPQQLNEIVAECVAEVRALAEKSESVQVTAVFQPHLPPILGDKEQIIVVLQNVLQNAIAYTPQGSVQVSTSAGPEGFACVAIADTGTGISEEELPHIFERFYRGTAVSQSTLPGTGLGLSIAKEILQRHNGSIEVESEMGVGSTFTICLPVANKEP